MTQTTLGNWMRQRRLELELTQEDLEARTGIPQSYLSQIERGAVGRPMRDKLEALSQALQTPLWQLAALVYDVRLDSVEPSDDYRDIPVIGYVPSGRAVDHSTGVAAVLRVLPEEIQDAIDPFAMIVQAEGFPPAGIVPGDAVILDRPGDRRPRDRQLVAVRIGGRVVLRRWMESNGTVRLLDPDGAVAAQLNGRGDCDLIGLYLTHRPLDPAER